MLHYKNVYVNNITIKITTDIRFKASSLSSSIADKYKEIESHAEQILGNEKVANGL